MGVVTVVSARGGCGASLTATNVAVTLARLAPAALIDLHGAPGADDLLLDLHASHAWTDLLPVAGELTERHLEIVACRHPEGLALLPAHASTGEGPTRDARVRPLLEALASRYAWVVVDAPSGTWIPAVLEISDVLLLVTTADPPTLRAAHRLLLAKPPAGGSNFGLVLNQFGRGQPAAASEVAAALGLPLRAVLPVDPRGAGYQVNFGRACALDRQSPLGRALVALARRIAGAGDGGVKGGRR